MVLSIKNRTAELSKTDTATAPIVESPSCPPPQPKSWDVDCNKRLDENQNIRVVTIVAYINNSDREIFLDATKIARFLDSLLPAARARCTVHMARMEKEYYQDGVDFSVPNAYAVLVDLGPIAYSRTSFSAYRLPGTTNWTIRQNLTGQSVLQDRQEQKKAQDAAVARQQEAARAEVAKQAASQSVQSGIAAARTESQISTADREFVLPVLAALRNMREAGTAVVCAENYEYIGGKVADRSIDGVVGVFMVQIDVVSKSLGLLGGRSWFSNACGSVGHDLNPGQKGVLNVKAVFRKYDSGWRLENHRLN